MWTNDHFAAQGVPRRPACPCCGERRFEYLEARVTSRTASLCGRDAVQVSPGQAGRLDLDALALRLRGLGVVTANDHLLRAVVDGQEMTVFADGRAVIQGTGAIAVARSLYARYVGAWGCV